MCISSEAEFQSDLRRYRQLHDRFYEVRNNTTISRPILQELASLAERLEAWDLDWWKIPKTA